MWTRGTVLVVALLLCLLSPEPSHCQQRFRRSIGLSKALQSLTGNSEDAAAPSDSSNSVPTDADGKGSFGDDGGSGLGTKGSDRQDSAVEDSKGFEGLAATVGSAVLDHIKDVPKPILGLGLKKAAPFVKLATKIAGKKLIKQGKDHGGGETKDSNFNEDSNEVSSGGSGFGKGGSGAKASSGGSGFGKGGADSQKEANHDSHVPVHVEAVEVDMEELEEVADDDLADKSFGQLQPLVDTFRPLRKATKPLTEAVKPALDAVNFNEDEDEGQVYEEVADLLRPGINAATPIISTGAGLAAPVINAGAKVAAPFIKVGSRFVNARRRQAEKLLEQISQNRRVQEATASGVVALEEGRRRIEDVAKDVVSVLDIKAIRKSVSDGLAAITDVIGGVHFNAGFQHGFKTVKVPGGGVDFNFGFVSHGSGGIPPVPTLFEEEIEEPLQTPREDPDVEPVSAEEREAHSFSSGPNCCEYLKKKRPCQTVHFTFNVFREKSLQFVQTDHLNTKLRNLLRRVNSGLHFSGDMSDEQFFTEDLELQGADEDYEEEEEEEEEVLEAGGDSSSHLGEEMDVLVEAEQDPDTGYEQGDMYNDFIAKLNGSISILDDGGENVVVDPSSQGADSGGSTFGDDSHDVLLYGIPEGNSILSQNRGSGNSKYTDEGTGYGSYSAATVGGKDFNTWGSTAGHIRVSGGLDGTGDKFFRPEGIPSFAHGRRVLSPRFRYRLEKQGRAHAGATGSRRNKKKLKAYRALLRAVSQKVLSMLASRP